VVLRSGAFSPGGGNGTAGAVGLACSWEKRPCGQPGIPHFSGLPNGEAVLRVKCKIPGVAAARNRPNGAGHTRSAYGGAKQPKPRSACCAGLGVNDETTGLSDLFSTLPPSLQTSSERRSVSVTRDWSHVRLRTYARFRSIVNNPKVPGIASSGVVAQAPSCSERQLCQSNAPR